MKSIIKTSKALLLGGIVLFLVFSVVRQAVAQNCVQPPAGLVSWWPGDGNADDIVGSRDGVLEGGASFAPGKVSQAFNFDGVTGSIVRAVASGLPTGAAPRTVELWSRLDGPLVDNNAMGFGYDAPVVGKGFLVFTAHPGSAPPPWFCHLERQWRHL